MVFRSRLVALAVTATALAAAPALADLAPSANPAVREFGKGVYEAKCALCHGKDGAPLPAFAKKNAPDFRDAAWQKRMTDQQIRRSIVEGVPSTMMRSFGKALASHETDALVAYVRSLAAKKGAK